MKHIVLSLVIVVFCSSRAFAQTSGDSTRWLTDIQEAHMISKATGKPVFAFFTGSDWCVWCKKLQADVFSKHAFNTWAKDEVVLLELDFPVRKKLSPNMVRQNETLKTFFNVTGFPTVWMFCVHEDKTKENHLIITPYGSLGYPRNPIPGKAEIKFLDEARSILASRTCQ